LEKSVVISVRIPYKVKESLQVESDRSGTSLNTLISQVLIRYAKWDVFAKESGFGSFPKQIITSFLDSIDDHSLSMMAESVGNAAFRDAMIFISGSLSLESFIPTLDMWLEAANMQYRHLDKSNGEQQYVIMHNLGQKWSFYLSELVKSSLFQLGSGVEGISVTKEVLSFVITNSNPKIVSSL